MLKVNPDKSQYIIFNHNNLQNSPKINIYGKDIHCVNYARYLGVDIDHKLNFKQHANNKKRKGNSRSKLLEFNIQEFRDK